MTNKPAAPRRPTLSARLLLLAFAGGLVGYTYWSALGGMVQRWSTDPQYSHGYLVPAFALVLLWLRRGRLPAADPDFNWWGVPLLLVGAVLHLLGSYFYYDWVEAISLLPTLAGLCLSFGGWPAWRWAWPAVAFLVFMVPLPYQLENLLSHPLQRFATQASTFLLETLGFPAIADGNTILLNELKLGVEQACNGLSMLVTFFALSTAVALLSRRPWVDRVVIVLSAAPIALVANVLRITVTGILCETVGNAEANVFFHDWAGWLMMPLALGLLGIETWILSRLLVAERPSASATSDATTGESPFLQQYARARRTEQGKSSRPAPRAGGSNPLPGQTANGAVKEYATNHKE